MKKTRQLFTVSKKQLSTTKNNFQVTSNSLQSHTYTHLTQIEQLDTISYKAQSLPQDLRKEKAEFKAL